MTTVCGLNDLDFGQYQVKSERWGENTLPLCHNMALDVLGPLVLKTSKNDLGDWYGLLGSVKTSG